jgi:uncharacterized protein YkuJ
MSNLAWGKPKVEINAFIGGSLGLTWNQLPDLKQDSAKLTTGKGTKLEAIAEGGDVVDVKYQKNRYTFECEAFVQKGSSKPIEDVDGIVSENYGIRLTPEDDENEGWVMNKTVVTVETTWTSKDGTMLKYTFEGLKPATGKMLESYTV